MIEVVHAALVQVDDLLADLGQDEAAIAALFDQRAVDVVGQDLPRDVHLFLHGHIDGRQLRGGHVEAVLCTGAIEASTTAALWNFGKW